MVVVVVVFVATVTTVTVFVVVTVTLHGAASHVFADGLAWFEPTVAMTARAKVVRTNSGNDRAMPL